MHEPVGRVQFGVFEKFTTAYLFQIAQEKSCDYLLINNIHEEISRWFTKRNARVSCNQGKIAPSIAPYRACACFESKRFDWPSVSFFDHWLIRTLGLLPLFAPVNHFLFQLALILPFSALKKFQVFTLFGINCTALSQSESRTFLMYSIMNLMIEPGN